jgi:biofilm PGA synthesis N-glycosyltransferase PgaC
MTPARPRIAVVVPFKDEAAHLPTLLDSLAAQTRRPDHVVLVDDGSIDGSASIAAGFAAGHPYALMLRRPPRPSGRDRMTGAHEWRAFAWAVEQLGEPWDIVAKLDADLRLSPGLLAEIGRRFAHDERLGIAGAYVSQREADGRLVRQRCPAGHVEGQNRFYRRACLEAISPVPAILGWDTIDEARARLAGWRTGSFALATGDIVHLRRMGSHDGVLRGYRRAGWAAYAYGADPLHVAASGAARLRDRPFAACGLAYLAGYAAAAWRREPRAEPCVRTLVRHEQRARLIALARGAER